MRIHLATSTGPDLRKVYKAGDDGPVRLEKEEGFQRWNEFDVSHRDVDDFAQLRDLFEDLSHDPKTTIVLGHPHNKRQGHSSDEYDDFTYSWFAADIDGYEFDGATEEAIGDLFPFLVGKDYVYYYSPSAGIKKGLRLRVIWRIRLTVEQQQEYCDHLNETISLRKGLHRKWIDPIYRLGGFIFTARPDLRGIDDPHPIRCFHVVGDTTPLTFEEAPDMVRVPGGPKRRGKPTLHWADEGGRHDAVFDFLRQYRDAYGKAASWIDSWKALSKEYDRLNVSPSDRREFGEAYVRKRFANVRGSRNVVRAERQQFAPIPLEEAEHRLADALRRAIRDRDTPRLTCIRVTAGGGKTRTAIRQLGIEKRFCDELGFLTFSADLYIPTHRLGDELEEVAAQEGLLGVVEKGRSQEVNGEALCFKHKAADELGGVVPDVSALICGNEDVGFCPKFDTCAWRDRKARAHKADLRIRPHSYLTIQADGENNKDRRHVDVVVIDESPIATLLHHGSVPIKDLCDVTRHDLGDWLLKFHQVLKAGLSVELLEDAGFTPDVFRELIKAEEALAPEVDVTPDMDDERSFKNASDYDRQWWKYASAWRRLRDCLEYRSMNRVRVSKDGKTLVTNWASVASAIPTDDDGRVKVQTVVMSATMDRSIMEQFFHIDEWVEIDIKKHRDSVIRQANLKGSKASVLYGTGERVEEYGEDNAAKKAAAKALRTNIARVAGEDNLFTFKGVAELGHDVAGWFNAVEGVNEWRGQNAFVFGRPLPMPYVVEDMARAIWQNGEEVSPIGAWYGKRRVAYVGEVGMAWTERHPDRRVEAVRWQICEAAILQAVARTRYVREPVTVTLLSSTPLPIEVDEVVGFDDLLPEEIAYQQAPVRTTSYGMAKRLFKKFADVPRTSFQYEAGDVYAWAVEKKAEFAECRLEGQKQWSRVYLKPAGKKTLDAMGAKWREPVLRKDDDKEQFAALIEQNRSLVEFDEDEVMQEALLREPMLVQDWDADGTPVERYLAVQADQYGMLSVKLTNVLIE